jgi:hypothetical protein
VDEALDHLETKTYELYDQRIFEIEIEIRSEGFECKKVKKICEMNQYFTVEICRHNLFDSTKRGRSKYKLTKILV